MRAERKVLESLSRKRLLDTARALGLKGLTGVNAKEIVVSLLKAREFDFSGLLSELKRDELKIACAALGIDESGKEKEALVKRIQKAVRSARLAKRPGKTAAKKEANRPEFGKSPVKKEKTVSQKGNGKPIEQYQHSDKQRVNNPPVGLVTPESDKDEPRKTYAYDPHIDPSLQWAGKAEHMSFAVPTVSLHVHERIDPKTIIEVTRVKRAKQPEQLGLFEKREENPPLREALDFYKHSHGWSNRLIAGDSLVVMNSLLEKEGVAGKVQMIYIDPPYGVSYRSNFQPFVNKRDIKDGKDSDLTQEPEMIKAFRDTWNFKVHSYLSYLRDRLFLSHELLDSTGSIFIQISDENLHRVRLIMDEVFGADNYIGMIGFQKTGGAAAKLISITVDYLLWYAKDKTQVKSRPLYLDREQGHTSLDRYDRVLLVNGESRSLTQKELEGVVPLPSKSRRYQLTSLFSDGETETPQQFNFDGITYSPGVGSHWKTTVAGLKTLAKHNRIEKAGTRLRYRRFVEDFPMVPLTDRWESVQTGTKLIYVVQTSVQVLQRCLLLATDPGDLVFDPTCGSGTTAFVAEQWGRRWITCDTSRVAIALAKQRLMTANYDYYELAYPDQGVGSGFRYETVPHITLKSIANNEPPEPETLYDRPLVDKKRGRITGPFTLEAVPAPAVKPIVEMGDTVEADESVARTGETKRQREWRDELAKAGIRAKGGKMLKFTRVEPLAGTQWLNAEAETKEDNPQRAVISFGPEHAPLEQRQVELAWEEARGLSPKPKLLVFAAFQFDPEAAKDIDELTPAKTGMTFLKVQMNTDLLTEDLKKKTDTSQAFWLIGQPDISVERIKKGTEAGQWKVEVHGFDYYNPVDRTIESGDTTKIAMWMLDTDYDGRSLYPRQVFFPMAGEKDGWAKLAKNLKAEIDEELIEAYRGTVSIPFEAGKNKRVAVKIVDDRGIESLRIMNLD